MRAPCDDSLPAELERSAPRDVGLTAGGLTLVLLAWLLAAGALGAGVALYVEAQRQAGRRLGFRSPRRDRERRRRSPVAQGG